MYFTAWACLSVCPLSRTEGGNGDAGGVSARRKTHFTLFGELEGCCSCCFCFLPNGEETQERIMHQGGLATIRLEESGQWARFTRAPGNRVRNPPLDVSRFHYGVFVLGESRCEAHTRPLWWQAVVRYLQCAITSRLLTSFLPLTSEGGARPHSSLGQAGKSPC